MGYAQGPLSVALYRQKDPVANHDQENDRQRPGKPVNDHAKPAPDSSRRDKAEKANSTASQNGAKVNLFHVRERDVRLPSEATPHLGFVVLLSI